MRGRVEPKETAQSAALSVCLSVLKVERGEVHQPKTIRTSAFY